MTGVNATISDDIGKWRRRRIQGVGRKRRGDTFWRPRRLGFFSQKRGPTYKRPIFGPGRVVGWSSGCRPKGFGLWPSRTGLKGTLKESRLLATKIKDEKESVNKFHPSATDSETENFPS
ncbi:hypothetical protein Salat_0684300 [Sesamum alatum]|uniref:Uncharacterized protein n=1 Tax=Sesamum alatum TaxID=300844 RepID=A0AAE1YR60_9LAMI|nr:hypothetical protein Salat_0684300 [Sesamum alatum]